MLAGDDYQEINARHRLGVSFVAYSRPGVQR